MLAGGLAFLHLGLANLSKIPELAISQKESETLVQASLDLMAEYGKAVDGKTAAWINLSMALSSVYGVRMLAVSIRTGKQRGGQQATASA